MRPRPPGQRWTGGFQETIAAGDALKSLGMEFRADREIQEAVAHAFAVIETVHELPDLPRIPFVSDARMPEGGKYRWEVATGRPVDIVLNPKGDHVELTAVLEIGHWLDHQAVGKPGEFASVGHPVLGGWRKAVESTALAGRLDDMTAAGFLPWRFPDGTIRQVNIRDRLAELLKPEEMFSRCYAQYVVSRSGDESIGRQIDLFSDHSRSISLVPAYWSDADFQPIAVALESVIVELGWRK